MCKNCWQDMGCSDIVRDDCPVYIEKRLDGVNSGKNGGRACWVVEGTLCDGKTHGTFVQKLGICGGCQFHMQVRKEEGDTFISSKELLALLRD